MIKIFINGTFGKIKRFDSIVLIQNSVYGSSSHIGMDQTLFEIVFSNGPALILDPKSGKQFKVNSQSNPT